jgi:putative MATE family efflux protein
MTAQAGSGRDARGRCATVAALLPPTKSIARQLIALAAPIIGINVLNVLMLAVDSALCGRLPNAEHVLTALGLSIQVVFLLMVAMLGLLVGTVGLVARAYGARAHDRVNHLLIQSTQLTVVVGVAVGLAGAALARPILIALGASPEVANIGATYLRPLMVGTPLFYLGLLYAGILRGVGNTRLPFLCALGANVVNAFLNYCLVLGAFGIPSLGVFGSAIGTVCAQLVNVVALVVVLRRGAIADLRLRLRPQPIDRKLAGELFRVGWPAALDMLVLNAGFLTAIGMLMQIDEVTVAAHGLGMRVQALAFVPGLGIAQATAAMVGQALGAGSVERARQITRASIALCLGVMSALALAVMLAAHPLVRVFDVRPATLLEAYSVEWMRILGLAMVPASVNIALVGLLQGAGATWTSLRVNLWTSLVLQVPAAWLLGFVFGLGATGVWLSFPIVFVAKAVLGYVVYRQERWAVTGVAVERRPATIAAAE